MKRLIGCTSAICLLAIMVGCGGVSSTGTLAYISNSSGTGFTVYTVNSDGTLTKSSISPQNTPASPKVLQFSPNGKWAYFLDVGGANVFAFTRAGNGTLPTLIGGGGQPTGPEASSLVISPNNAFLYVALPKTLNGAIAVFSIDSATGILGQVGSNITTLGIPVDQLVMSSGGNLLFGLSTLTQSVVTWSLNASTGVPTQVSTLGVGITPSHMILSANGSYLYITDSTDTSTNNNIPGVTVLSPKIFGYSVAGSGILTPLPGSPFNENPAVATDAATGQPIVTVPTNPIAGATSNDSRYLFIANQGSHNISVFQILSTGELNEVKGTTQTSGGISVSTASPFDCGTGCTTPSFVAVSNLNNALYVLDNPANKLFLFKIDQNTGRLRAESVASVGAAGNPTWITIR